MIGYEVDLLIRGKLEGLNVFDEAEEDALEGGMGYTHGTCLVVLVLFVRKVVRVNTPSHAVRALKDVDPMARVSEKEGRVKTCHSRSNNYHGEWSLRHPAKKMVKERSAGMGGYNDDAGGEGIAEGESMRNQKALRSIQIETHRKCTR